MRAVRAPEPGGADALRLLEVPRPVAGPGEVVLDIAATAVNRADLLQREGRYPPPAGTTQTLGLEAAGRIASVGAGVTGWAPGDRAMALLAGGGYADAALVPAPQLMPVPEALDLVQAAAVPEVFLTAWMALAHVGGLSEGEVVLIHAGASGVGTAAVQVARERGAVTLATSRSRDRLAVAEGFGATPIVAADGSFAAAVRAATDGRGADLIIDLVGPGYWNENVAALARGGRVVMLSLTTGARAEVNFGRLLPLQATLHCVTLRARTVGEKGEIVSAFTRWGLPRFETGALRPVVDRVMPIQDVAAAHRAMDDDAPTGKIVLTLEDPPAG